MSKLLGQRWYVLGARGVVAAVFGVVVLFWPGITVAAVAAVFGAFALIEGVLTIGTALAGSSRDDRSVIGFEGIIDVIAGGMILVWPDITAQALIFVLAAWAVATGVAEITAAVRVRRAVEREWLLAAAGAGSIVVGLVLGTRPDATIAAVAWLLGAYAVGFGLLLFGLAVRLRKNPDEEDATERPTSGEEAATPEERQAEVRGGHRGEMKRASSSDRREEGADVKR